MTESFKLPASYTDPESYPKNASDIPGWVEEPGAPQDAPPEIYHYNMYDPAYYDDVCYVSDGTGGYLI